MAQNLHYSSIAISSPPGAGRSTLLKNLSAVLVPLGWETFSGGDWSRKFAIELGNHKANDMTHHFAVDIPDEMDIQIDKGMREKLADQTKHYAVESWIAGWNMRGLRHVLKVLLMCDTALRVDRIVNRDGISVEDAKKHLKDREVSNFEKWKRMYGVDDFWDPKYYDLVINTYSHGPTEVRDIVLQSLGYYSK
jgi:predicted cytidylate kinase